MEYPDIGSQFGPYRLNRLIGRGGFGEVYEAEDTEKGRLVALKMMSAVYSKDPLYRERLFREARNAGFLNEPHVVPVHSYGEIDGHLYIDMRLIKGADLATVLADEGPLDAARAVWIVRQIASALDAAHRAEMVHRDIKPANILLSTDDFACLVDFGLANAATDAKLTATGQVIGSLAYMAPERFTGISTAGHRADVYALTCVLFECLSGSEPYPLQAGDQQAVMSAHISAAIPRPSRYQPELPAGLDEVIATGMAKNPNDRYGSAGDLARAAHRALGAAGTSGGSTARSTVRDPASASAPTTIRAVVPDTVPSHRPQRAPLDRPRPDPAAPNQGNRYRNALLAAVAVVLVITTTIVVLFTMRGHQPAPAAQPDHDLADLPRNALPFTGLRDPAGVAVDAVGNVYVADRGNRRIMKLASGSSDPAALALTGLIAPKGIAVGADGSVYVSDNGDRVVKLAADSGAQTMLPYVGLKGAAAIAVDAAGSVYVADRGDVNSSHVRVVKFTATGELTELPFANLTDADGLAVDAADNVYVTNAGGSYAVVKLAADSTETKLPISGIAQPSGLAVDSRGSLYVVAVKAASVVRQAPGAGGQSALPIEGLKDPSGVAVDRLGNGYVSDAESNRVLRFPAQ